SVMKAEFKDIQDGIDAFVARQQTAGEKAEKKLREALGDESVATGKVTREQAEKILTPGEMADYENYMIRKRRGDTIDSGAEALSRREGTHELSTEEKKKIDELLRGAGQGWTERTIRDWQNWGTGRGWATTQSEAIAELERQAERLERGPGLPSVRER